MTMKTCKENPRAMMEYDMEFIVLNIILHALTALSATLLNALILWTIFRNPSLQTPSTVLLCSLALSDLLMGGVIQPAAVVHFAANIFTSRQVVCTTWLLNTRLGYSLGLISLLTLAAISVDRCLAVVIKTSYRSVVTKKRTVLIVFGIWVSAFVVISTTVHCLHPKLFESVLTVFMVLSLLIITGAYSMAFYSLKRLSIRVINRLTPGHVQQPAADFNVFKYRRSLVTMVIVLAITLVLYLPFVLLISIDGTFATDHYNKVKINVVCEFVVTVGSIASPVVYLWRMRDLRQAAKSLVSSWCR